ncbi:hypothetical protein [Halobacteriovorax marinus]|uniref:hypothetical protein n=1 Tax=Halobacteriovorax marinus TaxID=97084 RepID=UPI003A914B34
MAIGLNDINKKATRGVKSILDVILERKEEKLSGKTRKKRVLRPWESTQERVQEPQKNSRVMAPFEKSQSLSEDELMGLKIQERAKELFQNISDFLQ